MTTTHDAAQAAGAAGATAPPRESTYLDAIRRAMREEMLRDPSVFLLGEDIGLLGGAFKATEDLQAEFGDWRVLDTPLAEEAIIGAAIGAAMLGMRPVAEIQFADFIACAFDLIVNVAAKMRYRSGWGVPMVIRAPSGAGVHGGPFHSQNPEAWFLHTPGIKIAVPSNPTDALGLLKAAIRDDDPVLFLEHKYLYRRAKAVLPEGDFVVPLGEASICREGDDLTIISYGAMVQKCLDAAAELEEKEDLAVEVIDLRSLVPLDLETIVDSVKRTAKVLIVHEDTKTLGIGAEVSAFLSEYLFEYLDGPILRVAPHDVPVPFSPPLEQAFLIPTSQIVETAKRLAAY